MSDYSEYQSDGAYSFSKGPKSLYSGKSDPSLLGVVLNVPQTDIDDEWGGTERIAWERVIDKIGELQEDVQDPYGSGDSLKPRMTALVGSSVSSLSYSIFNLNTPSMTLGNINLNVTADTVATPNLIVYSKITLSYPGIIPITMIEPSRENIDLGDAAHRFGGVYTYSVSAATNIIVGTGFSPDRDHIVDIGSNFVRFKDVFCYTVNATAEITAAIVQTSSYVSGSLSSALAPTSLAFLDGVTTKAYFTKDAIKLDLPTVVSGSGYFYVYMDSNNVICKGPATT